MFIINYYIIVNLKYVLSEKGHSIYQEDMHKIKIFKKSLNDFFKFFTSYHAECFN